MFKMWSALGLVIALLSAAKSVILCTFRFRNQLFPHICFLPDTILYCEYWYHHKMIYIVEVTSFITSVLLVLAIPTRQHNAILPWLFWSIVSMLCTLPFGVSVYIKIFFANIDKSEEMAMIATGAVNWLLKEDTGHQKQSAVIAFSVVGAFSVCWLIIRFLHYKIRKSNRNIRFNRNDGIQQSYQLSAINTKR